MGLLDSVASSAGSAAGGVLSASLGSVPVVGGLLSGLVGGESGGLFGGGMTPEQFRQLNRDTLPEGMKNGWGGASLDLIEWLDANAAITTTGGAYHYAGTWIASSLHYTDQPRLDALRATYAGDIYQLTTPVGPLTGPGGPEFGLPRATMSSGGLSAPAMSVSVMPGTTAAVPPPPPGTSQDFGIYTRGRDIMGNLIAYYPADQAALDAATVAWRRGTGAEGTTGTGATMGGMPWGWLAAGAAALVAVFFIARRA